MYLEKGREYFEAHRVYSSGVSPIPAFRPAEIAHQLHYPLLLYIVTIIGLKMLSVQLNIYLWGNVRMKKSVGFILIWLSSYFLFTFMGNKQLLPNKVLNFVMTMLLFVITSELFRRFIVMLPLVKTRF